MGRPRALPSSGRGRSSDSTAWPGSVPPAEFRFSASGAGSEGSAQVAPRGNSPAHRRLRCACFCVKLAPPGVSHGPLRGLQWGGGGLAGVAQTGTHSSERAVGECDRAPCSQLHVAGSQHPCRGRAEKPFLDYALRPPRPVTLSQGTPCSWGDVCALKNLTP